MIPHAKVGHPDQLATAVESLVANGTAKGARSIDLRVWDGIDARVLPDRGLDIGAAWFGGVPLAWISTNGEQGVAFAEDLHEQAWKHVWGGGLVTTCGLSNVGAPSEGYGLHGTYSARAAADVKVERTDTELVVTGTIVDPPFTLRRRIVTTLGQGLLRIDDLVTNDSEWTAAAPMLYHVNIGAPVWDGDAYLESDALDVVPRDEPSAAGLETWDEPPTLEAEAIERVFEHVGATWGRLVNPRLELELTVRASFSRLWQWVDPVVGVNALALEPANCSVLGRAHDIATGAMPFLDPGETRASWLTVEARRTS